MLTQRLKDWGRDIAVRVVKIFEKIPFITPNRLTLFGLVLNGVVALLLAIDQLLWGGLMVIVAGIFDMLDGALANITNRTSKFGAFLDSVVDRYSEATVLFGLLLYYYFKPNFQGWVEIILIYVFLIGSMMISYARARAEALEIQNEVGLMARPERIIILAIGLLFAPFIPLLLLIALYVLRRRHPNYRDTAYPLCLASYIG